MRLFVTISVSLHRRAIGAHHWAAWNTGTAKGTEASYGYGCHRGVGWIAGVDAGTGDRSARGRELLFANQAGHVLRAVRKGVLLRRSRFRELRLPVSEHRESGGVMVSATQRSDTQQIWSEFGERLRAFIARRVDGEADVDDILQDVFLRIHRHAGSLERRERLVSWLFQVTRNAIVDYYRAPGRRRELPAGAPQDLERKEEQVMNRVEIVDDDSPQTRRELAAY